MIVVTGSNGFIGSTLISEINKSFPDEKIFCMDPVPLTKHNLLRGKKNILNVDWDDFWVALESHKREIHFFIHIGAISSTTEKSWKKLKEKNIVFSQKVFSWCSKNKIPLIYASSAAVYGDGSLGFSEATDFRKLRPLNLYGKSKLDIDKWVTAQKKQPPNWYGLRFFNVFGPNEDFKGPMASMIYKSYPHIKKDKKIKLFKSYHPKYKDGEQKRDFVYVKDITRWIVEIMHKRPKSGIYNLGQGKPATWLDVATCMFDTAHIKKQIEFVDMPTNVKKQYQYFTCANMNKWYENEMSRPIWPVKKALNDYIVVHLAMNKLY